MLDIQFIRDNPEIVKTACKNKQLESALVEELLAVDRKRREIQQKVDHIRQKSNQNADAVKAEVQADGKPSPELIKKGKALKAELQAVEPELKQAEAAFLELQYQIPNVPAADVPVGASEDENVVIRTVGTVPNFDFTPKPHHELMESLDLVDTVRAVKIGGFRSYFLKNDGLLLEQAVLMYALQMLRDEGFTPFSAPILVNKEAMTGTGYFPWGSEDHYYTQDGQILAGTAEVALTAYRMGETLNEDDLPYKMVGIAPCFRREVGTHGKDTQGIIRVHQFNKVEQVIYTVADEEETKKWHEKMTGFAEKLLSDLELPYQVLAMCTGDMGAGQRKKYDIETWFPAQEKYRETHSASYFNDFQSRRLNIKYRAKDGTTKFVYTLNNTMAATPRLLAAIIENYQQKDGSITVPTVLRPYLGKDAIA